MELYVVKCFVEGCEECGDTYHIVGVFSSKKLAEEAEKKHSKYDHLHYSSVDVDKVILDDYKKYFGEK